MPNNLQTLRLKNFKGLNLKAMETDAVEHQAQTLQNFEITRKPGALVKSPGYALATSVLGTKYVTANKIAKSGGSIGAIEQIFEYYVPYRSETLYIAQTADDALWYWNNSSSQWTQFDDKITNVYPKARFLQRGGVLITAAGDTETSYPVWYGYVNREKDNDENGFFGNNKEYVGYYASKAAIAKPVLNTDAVGNLTFDALTQVEDAGDFEGGDGTRVMYRISFVYDGFQESLLSEEMTDIVLTGSIPNPVAVSFDLVFDSATFNDTVNDYYLNKRITAIKIYRASLASSLQVAKVLENIAGYFATKLLNHVTPGRDPSEEFNKGEIPKIFRATDFYLLNQVDINDGTSLPYYEGYGTVVTTTLTDTNLNDDYAVADKWNNFFIKLVGDTVTEYIEITDSTTNTLTLKAAPTDGNGSYQYTIVSRWRVDGSDYKIKILDSYDDLSQWTNPYTTEVNHTSEQIDPNYEDAVYIHNRMFVGPVWFNNQTHKDWVMWSNIDANGSYAVDVFPADNVIKVSDLGIREIKRLGTMMDRLIIFGDVDIAMLSIASGSEFGWELDDTYQEVGLLAPESLTKIDGRYYYLSADGVRVFDGNTSNLISVAVEDVDNFPFNVTTLSEAVGWHDPEKRQYCLHWPTDNKTYSFDFVSGGEWVEHVLADEVDCAVTTDTGEVLVSDGVSIFLQNSGTDHGGSNITPTWKSKAYNMGAPDKEKILYDYYISYRSNTAVDFDVYVDRSSSAETLTNQTLAAATTETSAQEYFPVGTRGYEFEFEVSLASGNLSSNTYVEINEIAVRFILEERA